MTLSARNVRISSLWSVALGTEIALLIAVAKYKDWEKMNVAENLSGNGPRPFLDLTEDNRVMDNTYGELNCPECNEQNMSQVGSFRNGGGQSFPHMVCQRCWTDAIFIEGTGVIWRSKEERLDRDNQPIL